MRMPSLVTLVLPLLIVTMACHKGQPPVARPMPPPPPPAAPAPVPEPPAPRLESIPPPLPVPPEAVTGRSLDDLNRDSPLQPAYFDYDSADINETGRTALAANAAVLKKTSSWVVAIEGHCDERGTPEYNLALGERRAVAARTYLISLGIDASRMRTVTYGSEFPFDPGHDERAWSRNRRAHFVITAK